MSEKKPYDLIINIGRYQTLHLGHIRNIKHSLTLSDQVLVLVGSANQPRTIKNPFTYNERADLLRNVFGNTIAIDRLNDYLYDENEWILGVQQAVNNTLTLLNLPLDSNIAVIGYEKDDSSYYLKNFSWDFIDIGSYAEVNDHPIDATRIRELYFNGHLDFIRGTVDSTTYDFLKRFLKTEEYQTLVEEFNFIKKYKESWSVAPYPPTFHTVDAVVVEKGHVLLIRRKNAPGKNLWAIPGGFLDQKETCKQAVVRELREETRLKLPEKSIERHITYQKVFDAPGRSLRGRTITTAFLIELQGSEDGKLPKVKGSDDAAEAKWFTWAEVKDMSDQLFEDHFSILIHMLGKAK